MKDKLNTGQYVKRLAPVRPRARTNPDLRSYLERIDELPSKYDEHYVLHYLLPRHTVASDDEAQKWPGTPLSGCARRKRDVSFQLLKVNNGSVCT